MEILNKILDFFQDKSRSIGLKTALFISTIAILIFVDLSIDFTYDLSVNSKIDQLMKVNKLKSIYSNDTSKIKFIEDIENDILNKTHYSDWFSFSFFSSDVKSETSDQNEATKKKPINKPNNPNPNIFSNFWMTISSSLSFWIMWPMLILLPFYQKKKQKGFFFGWLALNTVWASIIVMTTVIAYQIPLIYNNPTFNYVLNLLIHILIMAFIAFIIKKK